ncbi:ABC transporter permease [Streptococcus catagoni]|uniref:ABC transporter permease n=1 Tax=Streptococcus catagoni TaxID=2654874 RepID=UPI00140D5064|nr:ABC transporter permease [Streptococcus catagoni]
MLKKLLKYEFKSIGKWYFALNAGIIAIAALLSISIKWFHLESETNNATYVIFNQILPFTLILIFGALVAGSLLATLLIIINRFNQNIYGREGYLTMTLPVSEHKIILTKLISSMICGFFNALVLVVATAILVIPQISSSDLERFVNITFPFINKNWEVASLFITSYILSSIAGILVIYLSISLGQLSNNRRRLKAFMYYFAITIIVSTAVTFINFKLLNIGPKDTTYLLGIRYYLIICVETLLEIILFYFITFGIMKNKLNLQ